jgi:hypothetical protein
MAVNLSNLASAGGSAAGPDPVLTNQARLAATLATSQLQEGLVEIRAYIQEFPDTFRTFSFMVGMAFTFFHLISLIFLWNIVSVRWYLENVFFVLFGLIICIIEGKDTWYMRFGNLQEKVFQQCSLLMSFKGRGIFYLYLATTSFKFPDKFFIWKIFYCAFGICLLIMGFGGFGLKPGPPPQQDSA